MDEVLETCPYIQLTDREAEWDPNNVFMENIFPYR